MKKKCFHNFLLIVLIQRGDNTFKLSHFLNILDVLFSVLWNHYWTYKNLYKTKAKHFHKISWFQFFLFFFFSSCSLIWAPILKELHGKNLINNTCNIHLELSYAMFPLYLIIFHSVAWNYFCFHLARSTIYTF